MAAFSLPTFSHAFSEWKCINCCYLFIGHGLRTYKCCQVWGMWYMFNTLRPRQDGRHFSEDTFNRSFLNENIIISSEISLNFVPKVRSNNITALVQIMAWRWPGDKPLSERMMVISPKHICVTWPQWVNGYFPSMNFHYCIMIVDRHMKISNAYKLSDEMYFILSNLFLFRSTAH